MCVIPLALFQVEFRVLVQTTSRQSRWCPEGYPHKSLFTSPTLLKSLSGDTGVAVQQVLTVHADQAFFFKDFFS